MANPDYDALLGSIFFQDTTERLKDLREQHGKFVHYTTASTAALILQNRSIWMRNASLMNDFSEIEHGLASIDGAWRSFSGEKFRNSLDEVAPDLSGQVFSLLQGTETELRSATYLTCISEHPPTENEHGRLSMWRAYGGNSGIALVLSRTPFEAETDNLAAYSSPVIYGGASEVSGRLERMADKIHKFSQVLQEAGAERVRAYVYAALRFGALCTKHPAFREEREWRVIYSPLNMRSGAIEEVVETVQGIPQIVQKIPLRNDPEHGLHGAAIPDLVERIIIGPTMDASVLVDALAALLGAAGVTNPEERITVSGIPLRQW